MEGFYSVAAKVLSALYGLTNSYGIAILLLTVIVMILTAPLTLKSTRSMVELQRHQPELRRIQAEFKDDKERLNQEVMAFYKENKINPAGGCVPMLMQGPIFIVLYGVLRGITERNGGTASGIGRVAGLVSSGSDFKPWKLTDQVFKPRHLDAGSDLYRSLSSTTKINFLGVNLAISPSQAWTIGKVTFIPFALLMIGMLVSQIIQNRQIRGRNTSTEVNPQQEMMMKIVPFMLPVSSFTFPAGLGWYYFVQGLCRIGLQGYITRSIYGPEKARRDSDAANSDAKAPISARATERGAKASDAKPVAAKPKSAKSAAAQKKASSSGSTGSTGRKSGDPRARKRG